MTHPTRCFVASFLLAVSVSAIEAQSIIGPPKKGEPPRVKLETSKGPVVIELFENEAPQAVGNFVNLVEKHFYDGLTFHRVLPNFMAQAGCPRGDGCAVTIGAFESCVTSASAIRFCTTVNAYFESKSLRSIQYSDWP